MKFLILISLFSLNAFSSSDTIITKINYSEVERIVCMQNKVPIVIERIELGNNHMKVMSKLESVKQFIMKNDRLYMTCDNIRIKYVPVRNP
ncbi:MAG: hypothetical protein GY909_17790 [Oligoflexia bacterium]|nr:hypothetical protein [Oligoflexia bacterium]